MTLLDRLKKINQEKVKSKELKKELEIAIDNYDDRIQTSIENAKLILEMIEDEYPEALKPVVEKTEEKPEEKKAEEQKPEKKKMTKEQVDHCKTMIEKLKGFIREYETSNTPKKPVQVHKKRISTVLSEGMANIIKRAVSRELTKEKVTKVRPEKLRDARDKFTAGLKDIRAALGGISSDNDAFIESFKNDLNALIKAVEEKQKAVEADKK
jgi:hypothetical protein